MPIPTSTIGSISHYMRPAESDLRRAVRTTHRSVDALRLVPRTEEILALTTAIEQLALIAGELIAEVEELKGRSAEPREAHT